MSFKGIEKLKERRSGTYAACRYDDHSRAVLEEWTSLWSIPEPTDPGDYHTTIIYSRVPIAPEMQKNLNQQELKKMNWRFLIDRFEVFPTKLGSDSLVGILDASPLVELHNLLIRAGATHDFPDYIPHITLTYNLPINFNWKEIVPPPVYFIPSEVYFEPLDLNWKET